MAKSILQHDKTSCYLCGGFPTFYDPLDKHHIFGGALRNKSERDGLFVYIHHNKCHIFGAEAVHVNAEKNRALQAEAQKAAMERYGWSVEDFRERYYKNYL